ncbi:hypothetical protein SAMN05443572_108252 [Myxococcus fulvus]|uniref:Uncharacterized protein n=1 Tax=Myxococcus fulvus TaxID=33 RepID=A0ABY1CPT8_MYXFU|nr:hypothetical protein SAMN05443572_108252 [Myxococcus fulvus]
MLEQVRQDDALVEQRIGSLFICSCQCLSICERGQRQFILEALIQSRRSVQSLIERAGYETGCRDRLSYWQCLGPARERESKAHAVEFIAEPLSSKSVHASSG